MLIPKLTVRRCVILGLMLAGLVVLADGMVRYQLRQATSEMTFASAVAMAEPAGASDDE